VINKVITASRLRYLLFSMMVFIVHPFNN
jgi:hypothetical protein